MVIYQRAVYTRTIYKRFIHIQFIYGLLLKIKIQFLQKRFLLYHVMFHKNNKCEICIYIRMLIEYMQRIIFS